MSSILLIVGLIGIFSGIPIAVALGLGSIVSILLVPGLPLEVIPQRMMVNVDSFPMMAIPFYILAGEIMSSGGVSRRLVNFASALVGHLRAGLAMVGIVSSVIFAGISGSAAADTSAIGSILIPSMVKKGYDKGFVAALQACAGALGPIIPPSLVMVIYGSITGISVASLFIGGIIPGLLIGAGLMLITYIVAGKFNYKGEKRVNFKEFIRVLRESILALFLPVIIIGGIVLGIFTPTEAGVIATVYAFVVSIFIYKELKIKDIPKIVLNASINTASILFIVAAASVASWIFANDRFADSIVKLLGMVSGNYYVTLFLIILFVLLVGTVVETVAAAILLIPVLFPVGQALGMNPIHYGVVIVIALVFAGITPPVGVLLYITSSIAKASFSETLKWLPPFLAVCLIVLFASAYIPQLVTFLPNLLIH
ncbi:TRAP transporter large permease [Biomaibacter acetigenes]|jgi:C4-dicarboxylate transporter DctM subunit|uniref:TRAP transporter large permease n=1 Tax=Biomaibacter acetigenes TaxID=2316383 RepID=A0A3G2R389_9FIRM|nr:TRAP transporter large permease [Biomaibacter acetigenes]AYO29785.1 TRAP transporter large permease [Biomaibacter acetigenes]